jgi:hypothetical protein
MFLLNIYVTSSDGFAENIPSLEALSAKFHHKHKFRSQVAPKSILLLLFGEDIIYGLWQRALLKRSNAETFFSTLFKCMSM